MSPSQILENLYQGNNIAWLPLGDIGLLFRGNGLQKKDFVENGVPAIHYGQIYTLYGLSTAETKSFVSPELAKTLRKVDKGDVILTNTSENLKDVGKALVYLGEQQAVTGGHATVFKPGKGVLGKYLAYYTETETFAAYKRKLAKGTKVIDVSATDMAKILVPIPCPEDPGKSLEIQSEIVRILDEFSMMTTELSKALSAELSARIKQYNFYRDKLFQRGNIHTELIPLGAMGELLRGQGLQKKDFSDRGVPAIHYGQIYTFYDLWTEHTKSFVPEQLAKSLRKVDKGDVIITNTSENFNDVGKALVYLGEEQAVTGGHATVFKPNSKINGKYVAYFTQTAAFADEKRRFAKGIKVIDLSATDLSKIRVPVPYPDDDVRSFDEQARIVEILDRFSASMRLLKEDLPNEILLRKKQYAYYRDLLFGRPEAETAAT